MVPVAPWRCLGEVEFVPGSALALPSHWFQCCCWTSSWVGPGYLWHLLQEVLLPRPNKIICWKTSRFVHTRWVMRQGKQEDCSVTTSFSWSAGKASNSVSSPWPLVFLLTSLVLPWSCFTLSHSAIHKAFLTALSLFPELQAFAHHGRPLPRYQVALCFGEEFPDPQRQRKLITAHVSRTCAFAERNVFLGGYESARQAFLPSEGGDKFLTMQDHQDWGWVPRSAKGYLVARGLRAPNFPLCKELRVVVISFTKPFGA